MALSLERAGAVCIFVCVLLAFTSQSVLAAEVQQTYAKPYFLLWMTHSGYFFIAPLHLLILRIRRVPVVPLAKMLRNTFADQLSLPASTQPNSYVPLDPRSGPFNYDYYDFPLGVFIKLILLLTFFIGTPAMAWYAAVPLTSMTDITAIYNSNAIFAYVLAIYLLRSEKWEAFKLVSVVLSCIGVFIIAYGDSKTISSDVPDKNGTHLGRRLLGNLLALFGAVSYGFYEVWYKRYATCPTEVLHRNSVNSRYDNVLRRTPSSRFVNNNNTTTTSPTMHYSSVEADQQNIESAVTTNPKTSLERARCRDSVDDLGDFDDDENQENDIDTDEETLSSSPELMLAHANLITALIGVCTFLILWIPIPILHWTHLERFSLPPDFTTVLYIMIIVFSGVIFNAGFMILLSLWGPVVASVGNLCTLVLVAISDTVILHRGLSLSAVVGSALILGAFSVLVLDVFRTTTSKKDVYVKGEAIADEEGLIGGRGRRRRRSSSMARRTFGGDSNEGGGEPLFVATSESPPPPLTEDNQVPLSSTIATTEPFIHPSSLAPSNEHERQALLAPSS